MNLIVITLILAALVGVSFLRPPMLAWIFVWLAAVYLFIGYGIEVLVPASVRNLYLGITSLGIIAYVLADEERYKTVKKQLLSFLVEKRFERQLLAVVVALPMLTAWSVYRGMTVALKAPTFGRTIHPAPPNEVSFKGKQINLVTAENPYRKLQSQDAAKFTEHVSHGREVYYQNCVFCHGDDLKGDGIFAHGFNPVPANFNSATTIAMLQESYLFWRIAKGGPGLPFESGPWSSSMPAWEKFLSEDDIWDVILYLYEHVGRKPREREEEHH